jgi:hypothetical protein
MSRTSVHKISQERLDRRTKRHRVSELGCGHGEEEGWYCSAETLPASANRNTVKGLEERALIVPSKGREPLTVVWRLKKARRRQD